jgi:hypothetical protein
MQQHHARIALGVFVLVLIVGFVIFIAHTQDGSVPKEKTATSTPVSILESVSSSYSKGTYTIKGKVQVPTPCYQVTAAATAASTTIRVDLSIPTDTGLCLEEPAIDAFSVSVVAAKDASLEVYINGSLATSTS